MRNITMSRLSPPSHAEGRRGTGGRSLPGLTRAGRGVRLSGKCHAKQSNERREEPPMAVTMDPNTTFLRTLPGRYYYDPAIYAQEQERIYSTLWVCVGRAEEL